MLIGGHVPCPSWFVRPTKISPPVAELAVGIGILNERVVLGWWIERDDVPRQRRKGEEARRVPTSSVKRTISKHTAYLRKSQNRQWGRAAGLPMTR